MLFDYAHLTIVIVLVLPIIKSLDFEFFYIIQDVAINKQLYQLAGMVIEYNISKTIITCEYY